MVKELSKVTYLSAVTQERRLHGRTQSVRARDYVNAQQERTLSSRKEKEHYQQQQLMVLIIM